jgi:hypothetical protein
MRNPWSMLLCSLNHHRWQRIRIGGESGREYRNCKRCEFDEPREQFDSIVGPEGGMPGFGWPS